MNATIRLAALLLAGSCLLACPLDNNDPPTFPGGEPGGDPEPEPRVNCQPIRADACDPPSDPALLGMPGFTNLCWEPVTGSCENMATEPPFPGLPGGQSWVQVGWQVIADDAALGELLAECHLRLDGELVEVGDIDFSAEVIVLSGYPAAPNDCGGAGVFDWIADDGGQFAARARAGSADCDAIYDPAPTFLSGALVASPALPLGDVVECPL